MVLTLTPQRLRPLRFTDPLTLPKDDSLKTAFDLNILRYPTHPNRHNTSPCNSVRPLRSDHRIKKSKQTTNHNALIFINPQKPHVHTIHPQIKPTCTPKLWTTTCNSRHGRPTLETSITPAECNASTILQGACASTAKSQPKKNASIKKASIRKKSACSAVTCLIPQTDTRKTDGKRILHKCA